MGSFTVRKATKSDIPAIMGLIQELADFEEMPNGPILTENDLYRDGGFDGKTTPLFFCYVVEDINSSNDIIGFALCFYSYSTWKGKSVFLEDLYVQPKYRKHGLGKLLLIEVAKHAKQENCKRIDLHVLEWNPARKFYEKLGCTNITSTEKWQYYRFDENAINQLTASIL